ncbi:hypothetical protein [Saccharothrix coeruleofusca]|nr:hypothetical protein [Saccharothrix coeruleofusca]MBP2334553.1 hypothetical protein [Saccharothrix coeruleofusca]
MNVRSKHAEWAEEDLVPWRRRRRQGRHARARPSADLSTWAPVILGMVVLVALILLLLTYL